MAKKDNPTNGSLNLGEIGTIRNILMGDQITEYELKFRELEEQVQKIQAQMHLDLDGAFKKQAKDAASLKKDMEQRVNAMEATIKKTSNQLNNAIAEQNASTKEEIGKLLVKLGQQLLQEKE